MLLIFASIVRLFCFSVIAVIAPLTLFVCLFTLLLLFSDTSI